MLVTICACQIREIPSTTVHDKMGIITTVLLEIQRQMSCIYFGMILPPILMITEGKCGKNLSRVEMRGHQQKQTDKWTGWIHNIAFNVIAMCMIRKYNSVNGYYIETHVHGFFDTDLQWSVGTLEHTNTQVQRLNPLKTISKISHLSAMFGLTEHYLGAFSQVCAIWHCVIASRARPTLTWLAKLVGVAMSSSIWNTNSPHTLKKPWNSWACVG